MLCAHSNPLYAHSKYSRSNISIKPLFLLANSWRCGSYWLIPNLAHFFLALATSWWRQLLLFVDSKCVRICSMHIENNVLVPALLSSKRKERQSRSSWCKQSSSRHFLMHIEQIWIHIEHPVSVFKNYNYNFEWFLEPKHKTLNFPYKLKRRFKKILNVRRRMSIPRAFELYNFNVILKWWHSPLKGSSS